MRCFIIIWVFNLQMYELSPKIGKNADSFKKKQYL